MSAGRHRLIASAAVLALALGGAACGDDDDDGGSNGGGAPVADLGRYCELTKELDEAGSQAFEEQDDPEATEEDFEAREREFVESHEEEIAELERVAPEEISDDVETLAASVRGRAGLGPKVPESDSGPAEERVNAFEEENCEE